MNAILPLRSPKYILANMNYVYDMSIKRQLANLSIDTLVSKMSKVKPV